MVVVLEERIGDDGGFAKGAMDVQQRTAGGFIVFLTTPASSIRKTLVARGLTGPSQSGAFGIDPQLRLDDGPQLTQPPLNIRTILVVSALQTLSLADEKQYQ